MAIGVRVITVSPRCYPNTKPASDPARFYSNLDSELALEISAKLNQ